MASRQTKIERPAGYSYLLYLPDGYSDTGEPWPLVLFLHGVGERGSDLEQVKRHGLPKVLDEGGSFPFVAVSPQCPSGRHWSAELLASLLDDVMGQYRIDPDRLYVTGLSMGGYGAWTLAQHQPYRFAAIAPVCGGADPRKAGRVRRIPAWIFHGAKDVIVPLAESLRMAEALKRCGGDVTLTVYPEAGHDAWTETYENPELYAWLLRQRRGRGQP